ncbi:NAD-dependent epimerase/dehydratase family protein [Salinarimonas sp.]|uniref:NAD-dependent epimerase/dehydratase family protein n=1 Tax=Salinarimonas sp. TaxID=2766526 RepID=UPI0039193ECF
MNDTATTPPRDAPIALVLGITGAIGGAIAFRLAARGFRIRALSRRPLDPARFGFPVEVAIGDARDARAVSTAAAGASLIVHGVNPAGYRRWREEALPMLASTIEAAAAHRATILFPGNVYVFDERAPARVDEATPRRPATEKGRVRLEMETLLEEAARARGVRTIALRAGDFFGPGVESSWLAQAILKGGREARAFTRLSPPGIGHAFAYVPDLAEAFARLVDRRETLAPFTLLHFAGHYDTRGVAFAQAAARVLGRDLKTKRFSWALVRLAAPFSPFLREVVEMAWLFRHPLALDNAALERLIGPEPHTPLDQALARTLGLADAAQPGTAAQPAFA